MLDELVFIQEHDNVFLVHPLLQLFFAFASNFRLFVTWTEDYLKTFLHASIKISKNLKVFFSLCTLELATKLLIASIFIAKFVKVGLLMRSVEV